MKLQMIRRTTHHFTCLILLVAVGLAPVAMTAQTANGLKASADDLASHSVGAWGIDLSDRDPSVKPGDDFFLSQNGAWVARTQLSAQLPVAAYWRDLRRLAPRRLNAILQEVAANRDASPDSAEGKAGAFYRSFMDEKTIEAKGLTPLEPELDAIRAATTGRQMATLMGSMAGPGNPRAVNNVTGRAIGRGGAFSVNILQDQQDPYRYAVYLGQSGLNLPGPEYYSDPKLADIKVAYQSYIAGMLTMLGWPGAEARASEIVALETRIAAASWTHEQMQEPVKTYNPMTVAELSKFAQGFDWRAFLKGAELENVKHVVIDAKSAFPKIATIFAETPLAVWQARQAFALIDDAAGSGYLNAAAFNANFEFRNKQFRNPLSVPPGRDGVRAWNALALNIGDILSSFYVARYFSPEAKTKAQEMVANLRLALDARLAKLSWMSPETRAKARDKLARMTMRVGYPDKFQDYRGLKVSETDLYGNAVRAAAFNWRRQVRRLNEPFDRSEWILTPEIANYNYIGSSNAIEIPAGSLQPPFFDLRADAAVNYGAIGGLIGLAILNGFNGQGRLYDAEGRLRDWWTPAESATFAAMTKKLSDQYSAIEPLPGLHVKGELVVDESISDIGGLLIALDAYHLSLKGKPAPVLDGFTGDQRFFLGWASMWRAKFDPAFVRNQIATGQNSPPFLRVNGPVRNIDAWYEAFDVKPGDKLYLAPENRVRIW